MSDAIDELIGALIVPAMVLFHSAIEYILGYRPTMVEKLYELWITGKFP